jgi:hypothetical protein
MTSQVLFADNAGTTLAAPITTTQTSITVTSGSGALFPSPAAGQYFSLTLSVAGTPTTFEIVYCTARSGDTLTVVRHQEGTSALAFNAGDNAQNLLTAGDLAQFMQWSQSGEQTFTTSGTFTVPAGVTAVWVEIWGGGAGSGGCQGATLNCGSTGGGAGYARKLITGLTPGATIAATIGAAGVGGVTGTAQPTNGGTSSFGAVSATGGSAGVNGTALQPGSPGGAPGVGTGGDLNLSGGPGGTNWLSGSIAIVAAAAGTAPFMPPAQPNEGDIVGANAINYGGAGGAASTNTGLSLVGGNGSPGLIIVRW